MYITYGMSQREARERAMGRVLPRTQVGGKCQEAAAEVKIAKGMWWGA